MSPPDPQRVAAVLAHLGVPGAPQLGAGNEAAAHALHDDRVVRVLGPGGRTEDQRGRAALADELRPTAPFALPELLDAGTLAGTAWTVERRLPGRSLLTVLGQDPPHRGVLVRSLLDAVGALGALPLRPRPWWGDLLGDVRAGSWPDWLVQRAERGRAGIPELDPHALAAAVLVALPEPRPVGFLHLDAFPGNVLTDGAAVTAVIDLGWTSAVGDPRLDLVAAVAYLDVAITPTATDADRAVAVGVLAEQGLAGALLPVRRWLAAYWAWAVDDVALHGWCRGVLG